MALVFNDVAGGQGLIQECEDMTGLGKAGISGNADLLAQFTRRMNTAYYEVQDIILDCQDEEDFDDINFGDYPSLTFPLSLNRDYAVDASEKVLSIKRLDITYDGVHYVKAEPLDIGEISEGMGNDTEIDGRFSKAAPKYDWKYNSFWLYPRATQADIDAGAQGIIEWTRGLDEFVVGDTTQIPGIDAPFYIMLAIGASLSWATDKELSNVARIQDRWDRQEVKLRRRYSSKQKDRAIQLKSEPINYN